MAHDPDDVPVGAPGYCHNIEDVLGLQAAGLGSFKQTQHQNNAEPGRRPVMKGKRSKGIDFSLLQPPLAAREKKDGCPRLDPSSMGMPAGGIPKSAQLGTANDGVIQQGPSFAKKAHEATDPITHFVHLNWAGGWQAQKKIGKRIGQGGDQTWTWSQDPEVIASLPKQQNYNDGGEKFAVGADGQRYFNMFGREDMLPPATRPYIKCDKPARQTLVTFNDKRNLPFLQREGEAYVRPVHAYWRSDRMWAVMYDDAYMKSTVYESEREAVGLPRSRNVTEGERRSRSLRLQRGKPSQETCEESLPSDDESVECMNVQMPQSSWQKENSPPGVLDRNGMRHDRQTEEPIARKLGPWMPLDASSGVTPRTSAQSDSREPTLSMTPRSVSRATPRSMTPRSITPTVANVKIERLKPSSSVPNFQPPPRRDTASQVTPVSVLEAATPRMKRSSAPQGRTVTPRGTPRGSTTPRGDVTPRATTPRSSANQGAAALSMMPQLITRRGSASTVSTPRGSARVLRKSASEVVLPYNS